jgi:hypothetical protein
VACVEDVSINNLASTHTSELNSKNSIRKTEPGSFEITGKTISSV